MTECQDVEEGRDNYEAKDCAKGHNFILIATLYTTSNPEDRIPERDNAGEVDDCKDYWIDAIFNFDV